MHYDNVYIIVFDISLCCKFFIRGLPRTLTLNRIPCKSIVRPKRDIDEDSYLWLDLYRKLMIKKKRKGIIFHLQNSLEHLPHSHLYIIYNILYILLLYYILIYIYTYILLFLTVLKRYISENIKYHITSFHFSAKLKIPKLL